MSDERTRRVGQNQALYRQVNERIEDINEDFGSITGNFAIVCECGDLECMEQITISAETYERTRANELHFIVRSGHEVPDIESIVERDGDYVIIEKTSPAARVIADETDPRS